MTMATLPTLSVSDLDTELGRFFRAGKELFDTTGEMAKMPTCVVDEHWHDLIESGAIDGFAQKHLGAGITVDHIKVGGVDPLNWVELYEKQFGPLSPLWFTGANGLDAELYDKYTSGTTPDMSWDCSPAYASLKRSWDCSPAYVKA